MVRSAIWQAEKPASRDTKKGTGPADPDSSNPAISRGIPPQALPLLHDFFLFRHLLSDSNPARPKFSGPHAGRKHPRLRRFAEARSNKPCHLSIKLQTRSLAALSWRSPPQASQDPSRNRSDSVAERYGSAKCIPLRQPTRTPRGSCTSVRRDKSDRQSRSILSICNRPNGEAKTFSSPSRAVGNWR